MAIFGAIPMPQNSGDIFSGHVNNMIKQLMDRQHQEQQNKQYQSTLAQQLAFHNDSMALQRAAAGRAAQAAADAHARMDPMYEINQYKALENWVRGQQGGQPQQPQQPMPTQEMGEGMGMFSPEGMQEAQQQPAQQPMQSQGGLDMEMLKSHPMLRGFAKKHLGFDPMATAAQTPQEKQDAALDLFKQKEAIKAQAKGGDSPTNTVLTQTQQAIQGIDTVLPMLDDLIKSPDKVFGRWDFSPSKKAAYNAKTSGMIDTLVAAQSLPKVQASIDLVEQQIRRATNESDESYIDRLKDLRTDLVNRRGKAQSVVKNRKINTEPLEDFSQMSDDELRRIAGGG